MRIFVSRETNMWVKKQQLEPNMNQLIGLKLGKEYLKAVHLVYLTAMQSTSCETLGWMNHKLESRLPGEVSTTSYMHNTLLMTGSEEELKRFSMRANEESEKLT